MSSGDEDSKDQQVCQPSKWLHFSLQSGGTTTHYSHDKGDTKGDIFPRTQCGSTRAIHENECGRPVRTGAEPDCAPLADRTHFGAAILLTQSVWIIFDRLGPRRRK